MPRLPGCTRERACWRASARGACPPSWLTEAAGPGWFRASCSTALPIRFCSTFGVFSLELPDPPNTATQHEETDMALTLNYFPADESGFCRAPVLLTGATE